MHRRQQRARAQKVLHRRELPVERVQHGYGGEQSHLIGPIGREQDESHDHDHGEYASNDESNAEISPQEESEEEEEEEDEECILPTSWEKDYDMACNSMHEIDMMPTPDSFDLITCGGDRCVFRVTDINDSVVILKTLK